MGAQEVRATVAQAIEFELSCWPPREDGTKAPEGSWGTYTKRLPTREELNRVYGEWTRHGVGLVCGDVSHGLECLDIEDPDTWKLFLTAMEDAGVIDLGRHIAKGYMEYTPSGGVHWLWYTDQPEGNRKLARHADHRVRIETRGEGGYVIISPSDGPVHPNGQAWTLASGGLASIQRITAEERDTILRVAQNLDAVPKDYGTPLPRTEYEDKGRPGDDYNNRVSWREVLEPYGWRQVGEIGTQQYWKRPNKTDQGHSAVLHTDTGLLVPFSSSTPFPELEKGYSKFSALAYIGFDGDFSAAASELRKKGYGADPVSPSATSAPLVDRVVLWTPTLLAYELPEIPTLPVLGREGFVQKGGANLVYSFPKCGKSELLADLAKEWAGLGETVLILSEEGPGNWKLRLQAHGFCNEGERFGIVPAMGMTITEALDLVADVPHTVLVVDTLRSTVGYVEGDGDKEVNRVIMPLIRACQESGTTLVALYHARKMPGEGGRDISGHHALYGAFDRAIQLREVEGQENQRKLSVSGRCLYDGDKTIWYRFGPEGTEVIDGALIAKTTLPDRECAADDCLEWFTPSRASHEFHSDACRRRQARKSTESEI